MSTAAFGDLAGLQRTAAGLQHAHAELEAAGRALEDLAGELVGAAPPWLGQASDAFGALATRRRDALEHLTVVVATTAEVLHRLAARLDAAYQEALAARARAEGSGVLVGGDFRPVPVLAAAPTDPARLAALQRAAADLEAAHALAEWAWRAAAGELAGVRLEHEGHGLGPAIGGLLKLRDLLATPGAVAGALGERAERAWVDLDRALAARHLADPPLAGAARRAARAAVRTARQQAAVAAVAAEHAAALARRVAGPADGVRAAAVEAIGTEAGQLSERVARVPGLRRLPVVGVGLAGAGTVAEHQEAGWTRAAGANGGAVVAAEAAAAGVTAVAAAVGAPVVLTVAAVGVVGYGCGTAVHSLLLHGDLREFGDDAHGVADAGARLFKAVTPW